MPKEKVKWGDDLFTKLIKDYEDVIFKISEDREKAIRESLENCEEVKLFKFEDTSKKKVNSSEKVLSSTFSAIHSNHIILADDINLEKELKEAGIEIPDQVTEENLKQLFLDQDKKSGKTVTNRENIARKIENLKNNKFFKFIFDTVFVGLGRMKLTSYLPNLPDLLKDSAQIFDEKLVQNVQTNSKDSLLILVDSIVKELESLPVNPKETIYNLSKKLVIEESLTDTNYTEKDFSEGKNYLVTFTGQIKVEGIDTPIDVNENDIVCYKEGNLEKVEFEKNDIDLFNKIFFTYNKLITRNAENKIYGTVFPKFQKVLTIFKLGDKSIFNTFINELNSAINNEDIQNKELKRSNTAKVYIKYCDSNKNNFVYSYFLFIKTALNLQTNSRSINKTESNDKEKASKKIDNYFDRFIKGNIEEKSAGFYIINKDIIIIKSKLQVDKNVFDTLVNKNIIKKDRDIILKTDLIKQFREEALKYKSQILKNITDNKYEFDKQDEEAYIYKNIITTVLLNVKDPQRFFSSSR